MRTERFILFAFALLGLLTACTIDAGPLNTVQGSGNVVTETRDVSGFTTVSLEGVGQMVIDQTGSESLTITADDNLLPYIETRVRNGKLIISVRDNTTFSDVTELVYRVTVRALDDVELSGAGDIQVRHLDCEKWHVDLSGAGNITVSGKVNEQSVEISGAGAYDARDLESNATTVRHSGFGLAVVQAGEQLDVDISGMGSVEYIGNPTVEQVINGLGTVRRR